MWKWLSETYLKIRKYWSPDKDKPRLPEASGADYSRYIDKYQFENLVFKGGGAKGIAYIGACKILDEAGILPEIKRFAGTSAGAITATLLAIGMTPEEMLEELSQKNLMELLDPPRGKLRYFNWLPHIPGVPDYVTVDNISKAIEAVTGRGLCAGDDFVTWFGSILDKALKKNHPDKKGLDQDITFDKLYDTLGVELCIVAYNMVFGNETYFHVKTTPMIKIRDAVRMSMSIPVVFKPYEEIQGFTFIDGGLAANYPLWAFDGWYLSMGEEDTFQKKLKSIKDGDETGKQKIRRMFYPEYRHERFGARNDKTLGILMLSNRDREMYQDQFLKRLDDIKHKKEHENTKLYKAFKEEKSIREGERKDRIQSLRNLVDKSAQTLKESIEDVSVPELPAPGRVMLRTSPKTQPRPTKTFKEAIKERFEQIFSDEDLEFLKVNSKEEAFEMLLLDDDGNLTTAKLKRICENVGPLQLARRKYLGLRLVEKSRQYYATILEFLGNNSGITEEDIGRSVGIDVEYVGTMDFDMEPEDMDFLMRQGAAATIAFLEEKKAALET